MTTLPAETSTPGAPDVPPRRGGRRDYGSWAAAAAIALMSVMHGAAYWAGMGGYEGLTNEWPPLRGDHGLQYHHAAVTPHFLRTTGTTAGYDPSFMAGYPMSVVSLPSATLGELAMLAFGGTRPAFAYKLFVLAGGGSLPWLLTAAALAWGARPWTAAIAVALFLIYIWSDFPVEYVNIGMVSYAISVPLGLLACGAIAAYLARGGGTRWLGAAAGASAVFLVHPTSPMLVVPSAVAAYGIAVFRARREGRPMPASRHLGLWAMIPLVLAVNAFWLVPGLRLATTRGPSDVVFMHPEPILGRLGEIFWSSAVIEAVLIVLAPLGLMVMARRDAVAAAGLAGSLASGFGWGYLAGAFRAFDALQPGRHTYAFYSAACVAGGIGIGEVLARLRSVPPPRLDRWVAVGLVLLGVRMFGLTISASLRFRVGGPEPPLVSRPMPRFLDLIERLRRHVRPGERLLFEETGLGDSGQRDPFRGRHYSPMLPHLLGVEVIGGPYLHVTVRENFTQFGEGKLFGDPDWGRDRFVRYAKLYRPAAIACWSTKARAFCTANPDLVKVVDDDGTLLIGRVLGFEGATIRGEADVEASPNRIEVRGAVAGDDGLVVLRYHAAPHLASEPPVEIVPVTLEDDPAPFIAFRPIGKTVVFRMRPAPWSP